MICDVCGEEFEIDGSGIATHDGNDEVDGHDLDADHVPYTLENE